MHTVRLLASAAILVVVSGLASAQSTLNRPVGQIVPFALDCGIADNAGDQPELIYSNLVHVPDSVSLRLYFNEVSLPDGSFVRITSLLDGEVQVLDRPAMALWEDSSAYFNGDTVALEVFAGAGAFGTSIRVKNLGIQFPIAPVGDPGQCGICGSDDRVQSGELWSGRILPVGCTGSVYCDTGSGMVTAGHCLDGQTNLVVQFNVPNSNSGCGLVNPPVADQFPVQSGFRFANAGPGNDWGVYLTGVNSLSQTPFQRYAQFRPLAAAPSVIGATGQFWGYGLDSNCLRSQTQQFSIGNITSVNADFYDFIADVRGGNSGSGYLNADTQIIGIVTHCRVGCPNISQRIDDPAFIAGRNVVNPNCAGVVPMPPANDICATGAQWVADGATYTGTLLLATNDGTASCGASSASRDVWFRYRPQVDGQVVFDTCGSAFNTVLSVRSGSCTGNQVTCNDNSNVCGPESTNSRLFITAQAGTLYYIRLAGFSNEVGAYTFRVSGGAGTLPPINDTCSTRVNVSLGSSPFSTYDARTDGPSVASCDAADPQVANDIWYAFIAPSTGTLTISTCGSPFDSKLAVYSGSGCSALESRLVACNGNACGDDSSISLPVTAGQAFTIRVGGENGAAGTGQLNLSLVVPPACPWHTDACYADFNNDDAIDGDDVIGFFISWDAAGSCSDTTRDDSIDGDDVIAFFSAWDNAGTGFPGC